MMVYETVKAGRPLQKLIHMAFQLTALSIGIVGIYAAFKFHNKIHLTNMSSLHAWIGIATFCLFLLQVNFIFMHLKFCFILFAHFNIMYKIDNMFAVFIWTVHVSESEN